MKSYNKSIENIQVKIDIKQRKEEILFKRIEFLKNTISLMRFFT